ncbi:MAG: bifunctional phosphopantothenoylcysteine decarboxylase/phosphopantothenate--cysteine ligase CoaBC [Nitrososphaerota archaeon]|nr:bifunctional phosphopantothenoylcysteine decarboxylase/phosphopantothenate--cysteine ligase CoaBC [Nitrososphaerota archaeon]
MEAEGGGVAFPRIDGAGHVVVLPRRMLNLPIMINLVVSPCASVKHPSEDIVGSEGDEIKGRRIVIGITGSVSAYRAADIARSLMRHGAVVHAFMTGGAQKIIHPNLMEWATGNPVVTELTGKVEHVMFTSGPEKVDLVLIAPATANTIGKMAAGIDDTPVTSLVSSALGAEIPILVAPAMHDTMMRHPIIMDNMKRLERAGVTFIQPTTEQGKAKLASVEDILAATISKLANKDMKGLGVLITGGPTVEPIDSIRVLTNKSSGKMAVALAAAARERGARVTLVYGPGSAEPPRDVRVIRVQTAEEMRQKVKEELANERCDMVFAAAAVSDYRPTKMRRGKMASSRKRLTLQLVKTPKLVDELKKLSPKVFLTIFKAVYSLSEKEMAKSAMQRLRDADADMAVANDVSVEGIGFGSDENEVLIVDSAGRTVRVPRARKISIANRILDEVLKRIQVN